MIFLTFAAGTEKDIRGRESPVSPRGLLSTTRGIMHEHAECGANKTGG